VNSGSTLTLQPTVPTMNTGAPVTSSTPAPSLAITPAAAAAAAVAAPDVTAGIPSWVGIAALLLGGFLLVEAL